MELKVLCDCGQKFKFEVEPVGGTMPFQVNCPACGVDRTGSANEMIALQTPIGSNLSSAIGVAASSPVSSAVVPPTPPPVPVTASVTAPSPSLAPATGGLRINRPAPSEPPVPPPVSAATTSPAAPAPFRPMTAPAALPKYMRTNDAIQNNNFFMGVLGAVVGAVAGLALMLTCSFLLGFKFPFFGTIVGGITGYGARLFYKGTDFSLGVASAIVAFIVVGPGMYFMFGLIGVISVVFSLVFAVLFAFKVASG
jgi:hypothetical protein